jgi:hypothetical protein
MRLIVEKWILSELYAKPQGEQDNSGNIKKVDSNDVNNDQILIEYELKEIERKVETLYTQNKDTNYVSFIKIFYSFNLFFWFLMD